MKKRKIILGVLFLILCVYGSCYAQTQPDEQKPEESYVDADNMGYDDSPAQKLGRGSANILTFWMEVPAEMYYVTQEKNAFVGSTVGTVRGVCTAFVRLGTGIADTLTFFVPPYNKPLMKPEFAFDHATQNYNEYLRTK